MLGVARRWGAGPVAGPVRVFPGFAACALPALVRGFRSSAALRRGVNEVVRKKVKKVVLRHGHILPHLWKIKLREEARAELSAKFAEIADVPVIHYKPPTLQSWVLDLQGKPVEIVQMNRKVWGAEIRKDVVHRVVRWQRAGWQQGTHQAKTRSEKRGGGCKPRPQKGTGKSRMGSIRSPLLRGGGNVHPPRQRDHSFKLPAKAVQMGLRCALSAKFAEGNLFVIRDTWLDTHKTADLLAILRKHWKPILHSRVAILHTDQDLDPNFALAARNIWNLDFYTPKTANVYELVKCHHLVVTKQALEQIEKKLTSPPGDSLRVVKFALDLPPVKLADALPLRFGRLGRKVNTHMRLREEQKEKVATFQKIRKFKLERQEQHQRAAASESA